MSQISSDLSDRTPGLEHEPDTVVHQLLGILPRSWQARRVSSRQDRILESEPRSRSAIRSLAGGSEVVRAAGFQAGPLGDGPSARPL